MSAQLTHAQLLNEYDHITRLTYKTVASLLTLQSEKWTDELHYQALRDLNVLHAAVNRIAIPLLCRVDFCTASNATSSTSFGSTSRTGPKRFVVCARTQRSSCASSPSVKPK